VHLHTHDSGGGQLGTYQAALEAGVDAIDGASAPLSGMTSQPNLAAIVAATDHTAHASGVDLDALGDLEPYWERVRRLYAPFEAGLASPTGTVYRHEIPGGQLSNLRQQAAALGLGDRFDEIEHAYARCDKLLGRPVKVTPTSKVVGDLALYVISAGIDLDALAEDPGRYDLPDSVLDFLRGELGTPPGGWPEPFRSKALAGREEGDPPPQLSADGRAQLAEAPRATLNRLLFPGPTADYEEAVTAYGDLSALPTRAFWYGLAPDDEVAVDLEPGMRLYIGLDAVGGPDDEGLCTVLFTLNGQPRPVDAVDRSVGETAAFRKERADPAEPGHVPAPLTGVVTVTVREGAQVAAGEEVATIEAMKMESSVSAPTDGRVARIAVPTGTNVEPGDLVLVIEP
jgi:pyruvate carboxylase